MEARPTPLEIIVNMRNKKFREEAILEEVEKELKRLSQSSSELKTIIKEMEDRLEEMNNAQRLRNSSVRAGAIIQLEDLLPKLKSLSPSSGKNNSVSEDGWIDVNDRFPINDSRVLFVIKNNEIRSGLYLEFDEWGRTKMFIGDGYFEKTEVTHWRPLPTPPIKSSEDGKNK